MLPCERLRIARNALGFTQKQIAHEIGAGVPSWQEYERGKAIPGGKALQGLSKIGININWVLTGDGEMFHLGQKKKLEDKTIEISSMFHDFWESLPDMRREEALKLFVSSYNSENHDVNKLMFVPYISESDLFNALSDETFKIPTTPSIDCFKCNNDAVYNGKADSGFEIRLNHILMGKILEILLPPNESLLKSPKEIGIIAAKWYEDAIRLWPDQVFRDDRLGMLSKHGHLIYEQENDNMKKND